MITETRRGGASVPRPPVEGVVASLLLFELDVDDVVGLPGLAAVGRWAGGAFALSGGGAGARRRGGGIEVLGHRLAGALQVLDRLVDRGRVVPLLGLVDLVDRRADGRLVALGE